jgi:hypothetical protein
MSRSGEFVSDGGIEIAGLEDAVRFPDGSGAFVGVVGDSPIIDGPTSDIAPEACFTEDEFVQQRSALAMLAVQVEMFKQVGNHIEALYDLADNLADAAEDMRTADVAIAHGAYPEEISKIEDDIAQSVFDLEAGVRAYAKVLAEKYGIEIA